MLSELERECLQSYRSGSRSTLKTGSGKSAWVRFGFEFLLEAAAITRAARIARWDEGVEIKLDGSPVTVYDTEIEALLRKRLAEFSPTTSVLGEEEGGKIASTGTSLAVDPIDGTWAFLGRTATFATSLTVVEDGEPQLGMILNSATGEIGYTAEDGRSRLVQISLFGEADLGRFLPLDRASLSSALVEIHPQRRGGPVVQALYEAWVTGEIQMVRSPGGSPAWALLEASKGTYTYLNLWSEEPASIFDLAAGALLVRGAGGQVVSLAGEEIDLDGHSGPFIAGTDLAALATVAELVKEAIPSREAR